MTGFTVPKSTKAPCILKLSINKDIVVDSPPGMIIPSTLSKSEDFFTELESTPISFNKR